MSFLQRYRNNLKSRDPYGGYNGDQSAAIARIERQLPRGPIATPGDLFAFQRGGVGVSPGSGRTPYASFSPVTISAADPVPEVPVIGVLPARQYAKIVGQNVCSILVMANQLAQTLANFEITLHLDNGETFGGVLSAPLNRLSGGIQEPSLEMVLDSQPIIPIQSGLRFSILPTGADIVLDEDLVVTLQLATSHGGCF